MSKPLLLTLIWCFATSGIALAEEDPIKASLDATKANYESAMESFRDKARKWLDKEEQAARKRGAKPVVDRIKDARHAFEQNDKLPKETTPDLKREYVALRSTMEAAYEHAVKEYIKASKDDEANALDKEFQEFKKHHSFRKTQFLSELQHFDLRVEQGWFSKNGVALGKEIIIQGAKAPHSVFLHPPPKAASEVSFKLSSDWTVLQAGVAVPRLGDERGSLGSPLVFEVIGDGKLLWRSNPITTFDKPHYCRVNVRNVEVLQLRVICPGIASWARAVWVDPVLISN